VTGKGAPGILGSEAVEPGVVLPETVSVVIPVFDGERFLGPAIESVLGQTRPPEEVLVVDDGSTDGSAAVAAKFGGRVRLLRQANQGAAAARNLGVSAAVGTWLAFLDADDRWEEGKLERQLDILRGEPGLDGVLGYIRQFASPEHGPADGTAGRCEPMAGFHLDTMLIRRTSFLRVGLFDVSLRLGEAVEWFARARHLGLRLHLDREVAAWRRIHGTNLSIRERQASHQGLLSAVRANLALRRRDRETGG